MMQASENLASISLRWWSLLWLSLAAATAPAAPTIEWNQFRGNEGQGIAADENVPLTWSESQGVRWKTPIPGRGWSSPVIAQGRIWLTTAEETPLTDAQRVALRERLAATMPVAGAMESAERVKLSAVEVDADSGKLLRQIPLFDIAAPIAIHRLNSFASPTPVLKQGRLYCHFGAQGTACVDVRSGDVVWTKKLEVDHFVGPGSSPAATDTLLIVPCDGGDKQFVAALDLQTGDIRWQQDRPPIRSTNPDMRKANSTPLILPLNGRDVAIIPGAEWFVAYDAATGREVWRVSHDNGFSNVPRPVYDGQRLYLCSGYIRPRLFAVRTDGQGDVTKTHVAWQVAQQVPTMPSPVVVAGRIYMISDGGVASCLNAETGEVVWRERVDGKYSASLLAAAGRIYFCSQQGRTTVVAASDEFHVLARNELAGMLMASPAVLQGDLVLRTDSQLYRIDGK